MTASEREQAEALSGFLGAPDRPVEITGWRTLAGGRSATTVLLEIDGAEVDQGVLHLEPGQGPLVGVADIERQQALLKALAPTPVPAPRVLWSLPSEVLGRAGFVSDFQQGEAPDPWSRSGRVFMSEQVAGGPLAREFLARMVEIHSVPIEALPPAEREIADGAPHPRREHERWSHVLTESPLFADDPVLAYADAWLARNRPDEVPVGLLHGDYRLGNLVLDGDRIAAVLDWELAELGCPLYDLGIALSPPLVINDLACGLWEPDDLLSAYEAMSGGEVDTATVEFYSVLATFKVACLWVNASNGFAAGQPSVDSLRAACSVIELRPLLARALGLPGVGDGVRELVGDPALRLVGDVLREVAAGSEVDRERVRSAAASLAVLAGAVDLGERDDQRERVAALVADWGARSAEVPAPGTEPGPTLAALCRAVLADPDLGRGGTPLHEKVRAAVGSASSPALSGWPGGGWR